jgi:hypothetical protein
MKEAFVIPRKGLIVRNPSTMAPLPEQGTLVPLSGGEGKFWRRRIRCGDVSVITAARRTRKPKQKED